MRTFFVYLSLALLTACSYGYERLAGEDKLFYGTLTYTPEVVGGKFEGKEVDPKTIQGLDLNDYVDGLVNVCVSSSKEKEAICYPLLKRHNWILGERKDQTLEGRKVIDSNDVFYFRARTEESLELMGFKIGTEDYLYTYWLQKPIPLNSATKLNYLGNVVLQLEKSGPYHMYHLKASVENRFADSSKIMYEKLNIPTTNSSTPYILSLEGNQFYETTSRLVRQPAAIPVFIPAVK